ncbi:hypothetical protein AVEN_128092-1 [Araneus ventricosus]|uniref:Uncharacterized protein n=1 Tax=Araneus ventricosus TaxID=182803 RepID=A0A4Y2A1L5_ARAVE|nr:hypothetical protein AVEN_128092-1 [Araneus ventricosus]
MLVFLQREQSNSILSLWYKWDRNLIPSKLLCVTLVYVSLTLVKPVVDQKCRCWCGLEFGSVIYRLRRHPHHLTMVQNDLIPSKISHVPLAYVRLVTNIKRQSSISAFVSQGISNCSEPAQMTSYHMTKVQNCLIPSKMSHVPPVDGEGQAYPHWCFAKFRRVVCRLNCSLYHLTMAQNELIPSNDTRCCTDICRLGADYTCRAYLNWHGADFWKSGVPVQCRPHHVTSVQNVQIHQISPVYVGLLLVKPVEGKAYPH